MDDKCGKVSQTFGPGSKCLFLIGGNGVGYKQGKRLFSKCQEATKNQEGFDMKRADIHEEERGETLIRRA